MTRRGAEEEKKRNIGNAFHFLSPQVFLMNPSSVDLPEEIVTQIILLALYYQRSQLSSLCVLYIISCDVLY